MNLDCDSRYKNLSDIVKDNLEKSFIETQLLKIKTLSNFIKKINIEDDAKYLVSQSKEYKKLLQLTKNKIENIIKKSIIFAGKDGVNSIPDDFDIKNFEFISEFVDDLMERVSDNIDIVKGKKKDKKESEIEEELKTIKSLQQIKSDERKKLRAKNENQNYLENQNLKNNLELPTTNTDPFDIDNSYYPFIPKINTKPYGINGISADIIDAKRLRNLNLEKFKSINFEDRKLNREMKLFDHPYKEEIILITNQLAENMDKFIYNTRSAPTFETINIRKIIPNNIKPTEMTTNEMIEIVNDINMRNLNIFSKYILRGESPETSSCFVHFEIEHLPLNETKFVYVDTQSELHQMVTDIESYAEEIAVDLEHHSLESYLGLTCLMQISTRFCDYIIDTIKLRCYMQELNQIFCNPRIVKVLHGADYDIEWLQKDFGVYIVNMFDTGQAARILQLPSFGLSSLLSSFCNVLADKKYQLADWRIRPLPAEMMKYAREDTHYLLFIYDCLRRKLIEKSLMRNEEVTLNLLKVCKKSNELALKLYLKPIVKSEDYYQMLARNVNLTKTQRSNLKLIYKFRDYVARKLDLSNQLVLSNRNLFNLAKMPNISNDTLFMNLDKNSRFRNFVPELFKIIQEKLIRNEKKIDNGSGYKFLESNYINEIKNKLNISRDIVNNISKKGKTEHTLSYDNFKLDKVNLNEKINYIDEGENINFKEKKKSKFFSNEIYKNNHLPSTNFNTDYEMLIQKFNNFNILSFLQEKYPYLQIKIENKIANNVNKPKLIQAKTNDRSKINENIQPLADDHDKIYLKNKRKPEEMLDLTDYSRPVTQKQMKVSQDLYQESDITQAVVYDVNRNNSELSKNMIASEKFIKNLLNKSKALVKGKKSKE